VLTRPTYIGRHRFNTNLWKMRERNPGAAVVEMAVPPIVDPAEFEAVQMLLRTRMLQNCASAPPMQTPDSTAVRYGRKTHCRHHRAMLEDCVTELKAIRDQARADASAVIRTDVPQSLSLDFGRGRAGFTSC
jgi:hypothetical protein